ncbi:MAG: hypothetical protein ACR2I8_03450 [Steroidobacteraceae bacterium]
MVTAINGTPLDDPARGMEILSTMNSASNVTVTVERNGEPVQVNINNAQIAAEAAAARPPQSYLWGSSRASSLPPRSMMARSVYTECSFVPPVMILPTA